MPQADLEHPISRETFLSQSIDERLRMSADPLREANPGLDQSELDALLFTEMQFQEYDRDEAGMIDA